MEHPTSFATSPFSPSANPTHTDPLTKATQTPRHSRPRSTSLSCTPTTRSASSPQRYRRHDTATLPYTKDTGLNTSTDSELRKMPRPTERATTTTQDSLRAAYRGNEPPSNRLQTAIPRTAQHSVHTVPQTDSSHHTALTQCSDQPANPTTIPDCTRALHPRDPMPLTGPRQQAAHSQSVQTPDPCAQNGSPGGRGWPGRRRPKTTTPETTPQDLEHQHRQIHPARHPQDRPIKLQATRTTHNSFPTPELAGTHLT